MMILIRKTILFLFLGFVLSANPQVNENMLRAGLRSGGFYRAWIFFNDKTEGESTSENVFQKALDNLDNRTRMRRSKVRHFSLVDNRDIPVSPDYIDEIKYTGVTIRTVSKWLNAVSVSGTIEQLRSISDFPFVKKIDPVYGGKRKSPVQRSLLKSSTELGRSDYGPSYDQLDQINVIAAHEAGYTGAGVRVLMLDTGYYTDHEAIHEEQVIAEWDFINNDGETQNEEGDPDSQHNHGTYTLSALGGRFDGELYGPAYGAEFLLAKTEDVSQEVPIEEDQYVAGLEWGESLGADIASSSLGYIDWYEFEDLDGMTAVTTIAVNTAIENGMVVVTAVGNSGTGGIVVPADSENVIACGAVDSNGNIASFSSQGPTADGRIKPEVCALGVSTYCAGVNSTSAYRYENGSSLATPLVAGAAACVLQAHPDWTPQQVREALMMTASDPENPDNQYGWGIIDVIEAINYNNPNPFYPVYYTLSNPFPNPFNSWIQFDVGIYSEGKVILTVFDINGKEIERLWSNNIEKGVYPIQWNADGVSSGVYFINLNGKNGSVNRKICLQK
jgi:subtilisin family serine protease